MERNIFCKRCGGDKLLQMVYCNECNERINRMKKGKDSIIDGYKKELEKLYKNNVWERNK